MGSGDVMSLWFARRLTWITCLMMFLVGGLTIVGDLAFGGADDPGPRGPVAAIGFAVLAVLGTLIWAVRGLSRGRRGSWTTTVVLLTGWAVFVTGALDVPSMREFTFLNWGLTLPAIGLLLRRGTREAYRQGAARDMPGF